MEISGEYTIKAPRSAVWAALNDPETLKGSIAGCEELLRDGDGFTATVVARVGPVKARFGGRITLSDLDPPNGYTISGEGQGGAAGFAKGCAKVRLEDVPGGGTILKYAATAQIGGKLAQIGSRLVEGAARKMAEEFFGTFSGIVEGQAGSAGTPGGEETVASETPAMAKAAGAPEPEQKGLHPAIWISGLVGAVGVVLYFFTRR
jgi:hypothetical protein